MTSFLKASSLGVKQFSLFLIVQFSIRAGLESRNDSAKIAFYQNAKLFGVRSMFWFPTNIGEIPDLGVGGWLSILIISKKAG